MKKIYTTNILIFLAVFALQAQTTITNSTFPVAGDMLRTGNSVSFTGFDPEIKGAGQIWDFSNLSPSTINVATYLDASEGEASDSFPEADLLLSNELQDIYYKTSNNRIVEVGRTGLDPIAGAVPIEVMVDGNSVLRRAPVSFGDTYDDEFGFELIIPKASLPDSILAQLGALVTLVGDFRVAVSIEVDEEVDAWGTASMPANMSHDVLRVKRTTLTETMVEVQFAGSWVDISTLPFALPEFLAALLDPQTVISYVFLTNDVKEELVNISTDTMGNVLSTVFQTDELVSSNEIGSIRNAEVVAFPNPSYGNLRFEFRNMPADSYTVEILDILGRKIWTETSNRGQQLMEANLVGFRRGTYLYRVSDSRGNKLTTKRLMIVRP